MTHPLINDPLVDAPGGQVRSERVPIGVEADLEPTLLAAQAPGRAAQRLAEVAGGRLHAERAVRVRLADHELPPGSFLAPRQQQRLQLRVQIDSSRRLGLL